MKIKDLHEKISRDKTAVFTFGRMNPPTIGHEKLINKLKDVASKNRADWFVYLSSSQDSKKNPLSFDRKIFYAKKMFGRDVNQKNFPKEPTALHAASSLHDKGYKKLVMVVGSDRVGQFEKLMKQYNGVDNKPHGYYNFDTIDVVSAGERDPDAEGVEGMSASKLRGFAVKGDFTNFSKGLPGLSDKDAKSLFNEIRKGLKLQAISEKLKIEESVMFTEPVRRTESSQKKYKELYKTKKLPEEIKYILLDKAKEYEVPFLTLKGIYEKAERQWNHNHKVGELKETFAMNKVNSHLMSLIDKDNIDDEFKLWIEMNESQDVVVSTPTGTYVTKTRSMSKKRADIRNKFRKPEDKKSITVKRAIGNEKRYIPRQNEEHGAGERGTDKLVKKYKKDTPGQEIQEMSKPHVFVGIKDTDPRSNLRPSVSYKPGKSDDLVLIKPVETDFFNENLKGLVNSPYDFLEELGLHTNFGILIRDKGNERKMVDAIAKKKSFITSGYYDNISYAVGTNENSLRKALENSKMYESLDEATGNEIKKYMKSKWNTDVRASKVGTGKSMRVVGKIPNDFRAFVIKKFEPNAKIMDKNNIDYGNIRGNYVSLRVGEWDELLKEDIQEKAVSKQQQKFFGLVRAIQKGKASGSPEAEKAARDMSKKDVKDFASTKHKGLPKKIEEDWEFDPNTLLQQLGGNKFMVMTGAKNLMVDKEEKSLHMRIGKNSKGINHLKITYMPDDTYTMDFGKIRKMDYKVIRSIKNVYAEALQDVFTEVTGMYTSL